MQKIENDRKRLTTKQKIVALKKAGAIHVPGTGWAFPDNETKLCRFDRDIPSDTTEFLGSNAEEAFENLKAMDGSKEYYSHPTPGF